MTVHLWESMFCDQMSIYCTYIEQLEVKNIYIKAWFLLKDAFVQCEPTIPKAEAGALSKCIDEMLSPCSRVDSAYLQVSPHLVRPSLKPTRFNFLITVMEDSWAFFSAQKRNHIISASYLKDPLSELCQSCAWRNRTNKGILENWHFTNVTLLTTKGPKDCTAEW